MKTGKQITEKQIHKTKSTLTKKFSINVEGIPSNGSTAR